MKFKKDKSGDYFAEEGSRILTVTDKDGDVITLRSYVDGKNRITIGIDSTDSDGAFVGLSRSKALKLARAIIDELNPSVL